MILFKYLTVVQSHGNMCESNVFRVREYSRKLNFLGGNMMDLKMKNIRSIIRKHMNDGWISVVHRLPEPNEDEVSEDVLISFSDSYSICIGFYDFNKKRWYVHGSGPCIGRVVAWRPLPEPYCPERSDGE